MTKINASIGMIVDDKFSKVYITQRQKHQSYSEYWEFPGGKVEKGESFENCVKRELFEEVGITVESMYLFLRKTHKANENLTINLEFYIVDKYSELPYSKENQKLQLIQISKLKELKFLPGSVDVLNMLYDISIDFEF